MELSGRKVVVLVEDQYEDLELWYPALRLREAGAEVTVVGPEERSYSSKHGYPVRAERAVSAVAARDIDAVVIPGGYAPDHMRACEPLVKLVRDAFQAGKVVAAICHAGWVLASAGILRGKQVTGYHTIQDDLRHAGAEYVDREVVRDENLITSRHPGDLPAFCREIVTALAAGRAASVPGRRRQVGSA